MQHSAFIFAKKPWLKWAGIIALIGAIYFAHKSLQTHLGQEALSAIDLDVLNFNVALAKAQAHNKLVLADMSAIWCPTCRKLDKEIFSNEQVKNVIEQHFVFARVEYESNDGEAFMKKYGVSGFPVLLVLNDSGEKLIRLPLTFDPELFVNNLNQVVLSQQGQGQTLGK